MIESEARLIKIGDILTYIVQMGPNIEVLVVDVNEQGFVDFWFNWNDIPSTQFNDFYNEQDLENFCKYD